MSQQPIPLPQPVKLDLDNIQGDILSGLPKRTQTYFFFQITDVALFRHQLVQFIPFIKTVNQVLKDRKDIDDHKKKGDKTLIPLAGVNIAFSHKGFVKLGVDDSNLTSNDPDFGAGQKQESGNLLDPGVGSGPNFVPTWEPAFLRDIHGVILVSGDSHPTVDDKLKKVKQVFGVGTPKPSIIEVTSLVGDVRPGDEKGHEHFGFLDGISNPTVIGFDNNPNPGPKSVDPGILLLGEPGDPFPKGRPAWVVDGSFLVIRYLFQKVPEFNTFLEKNPVPAPGLSPKEGSDLLGARLVGRWKSGAPIDLAPFKDDLDLAHDPTRNNNFTFAAEKGFQKICPFSAHVRKTNPRDDLIALGVSIDKRRIMRRGIQFGPELTKEEVAQKKTIKDRGLIFASYQTSIVNGFAFLQKSWANNPKFPPETTPEAPGLDPIIGQGVRTFSGTDPAIPTKELTAPAFVIPRGGEYFFSPSLKALKGTLATK